MKLKYIEKKELFKYNNVGSEEISSKNYPVD
jgi:hypothetical protein